jgi:hypothetical protein
MRTGAAPQVLGGERRRDPLFLEQRRIDPEGERPQCVEGGVDLAADLCEHPSPVLRVLLKRRLGEPELDRERDQMLLRSVVDVPFQPAPFLVLCGDDRCRDEQISRLVGVCMSRASGRR